MHWVPPLLSSFVEISALPKISLNDFLSNIQYLKRNVFMYIEKSLPVFNVDIDRIKIINL